jgi:hypothetical protein
MLNLFIIEDFDCADCASRFDLSGHALQQHTLRGYPRVLTPQAEMTPSSGTLYGASEYKYRVNRAVSGHRVSSDEIRRS